MESGFTSVQVSARCLRKNAYRFSVVLEGNRVKAYLVSRSDWNGVVDSHRHNGKLWSDPDGYEPLVAFTNGFIDTARELGWVVVGDAKMDEGDRSQA